MSHETANQYDERTPFDKLVRYRFAVDPAEYNDEASADVIYTNTLMALDDLADLIPGVKDKAMELLPGEYDPRKSTFHDWHIQLQLLPLQLLECDLPSLEELDPAYVREAYHAALLHNKQHFEHVSPYSNLRVRSCPEAAICPAKAAFYHTEHQLRQLAFNQAFSDSSTDEFAVRREEIHDAIAGVLGYYQLMNREFYDAARGRAERHAQREVEQLFAPLGHA